MTRPGPKVVPVKFLPINGAPYSKPDVMKYPLGGVNLVIGFERDSTARAYPVKILGGPQREIINDHFGQEP